MPVTVLDAEETAQSKTDVIPTLWAVLPWGGQITHKTRNKW